MGYLTGKEEKIFLEITISVFVNKELKVCRLIQNKLKFPK